MRKIIFALLFMSQTALAKLPREGNASTIKSTITSTQFWKIVNDLNDIYKPIFHGHKINFWFEARLDDPKIELRTEYYITKWNNDRKIIVKGGLVKSYGLNEAGMIMLLCHEIGHSLAGYPAGSSAPAYSFEGQAYYYAGHVCARRAFDKYLNRVDFKNAMTKIDQCEKNFDSQREKNICYLTHLGAQNVADMILVMQGTKRGAYSDQHDSFVAKSMSEFYPTPQCIYDSIVAGLDCHERVWDDAVIPANKNATCRNRPQCWYVP